MKPIPFGAYPFPIPDSVLVAEYNSTLAAMSLPVGTKVVTITANAQSWVHPSSTGVLANSTSVTGGGASVSLPADVPKTYNVEGTTVLSFISGSTVTRLACIECFGAI